ncbi:MAG: hypothetical protein AAGA66_04290 [Bacteroidota bacterium]
MKIIQPTLERFLEATNKVHLRIKRADGTPVIVAGGFRDDGVWTEFHSKLEPDPSHRSILTHLQLLALLIKKEKKRREFQFKHPTGKKAPDHPFQALPIDMNRCTENEGHPDVEINLGLN